MEGTICLARNVDPGSHGCVRPDVFRLGNRWRLPIPCGRLQRRITSSISKGGADLSSPPSVPRPSPHRARVRGGFSKISERGVGSHLRRVDASIPHAHGARASEEFSKNLNCPGAARGPLLRRSPAVALRSAEGNHVVRTSASGPSSIDLPAEHCHQPRRSTF